MSSLTLNRKRKSAIGLLVIVVVVGFLFYFLRFINVDGGKVVPSRRIIASGHRVRDTDTGTTPSLLLRERHKPEMDLVQKDGYPPVDFDYLGDPERWKDFSRTHYKVLKDRTRQSGLSRTFGPGSKTKETGLSEKFTLASSHEPEPGSVARSTESRTESMSDAVKLRPNSVPLESGASQSRSNIPKVKSATEQGLDDSRSSSRTTDSSSRSSRRDRFRFLIDVSGVCDLDTLVLIVICSAWENASRREVIRATWASLDDHQLRVLFIIGQPRPDQWAADHQRTLEEESLNRGDLLQANFIDSYANLTLKSIAMLQWVDESCQAARFLLKADDDVLVNTPLLLRDLALTRHRRFVMGRVVANTGPARGRSSKWFVSPTDYPRNFYPQYMSGPAYVISGDLVHDLHAAAVRAKILWIEDVFITGLLLEANGSYVINAQHIDNKKFDTEKEFSDPCDLKRLIVKHLPVKTDLTALWSLLTSPTACLTQTSLLSTSSLATSAHTIRMHTTAANDR